MSRTQTRELIIEHSAGTWENRRAVDVPVASISLSHECDDKKVENNAPKHKISKSPGNTISLLTKQARVIPLRRNLRELRLIRFIHLTPQTRCTHAPKISKPFSRENARGKRGIPANTNCPTAAANPAKKELKGYPPVKHAYTNCTAPTYMRKTRKASMMSREFGVLAQYDFQSSTVALERLERERES